jgi:hypothetical protein
MHSGTQRGLKPTRLDLHAQSARIPIARLKTCTSLFECHIDSLFSAKNMAENIVGLRPNVACEFKRAGFLEWRNDWNLAADWAATKPVTDEIRAIGQLRVVVTYS